MHADRVESSAGKKIEERYRDRDREWERERERERERGEETDRQTKWERRDRVTE